MRKGLATRTRIIDDAIRLASVEGLGGVTIGRLAERTGMSKAGLFAHFKSKEEVEVAVLEASIARFGEMVFAPALAQPRGEPRLRAFLERWLVWATDEEHQPGGCIIFQASVELDDQPGRPREVVAAAQRQWLDTLERATQLAIEEGHFRRDVNPRLFAFQIQGIMFATHQLMRLLRDPRATQLMWDAVDQLFGGARKGRA